MKHLQWLWGSAALAAAIGLGSNFILKALGNHTEATVLEHQARGGVVGAIAGLAFALAGKKAARKKASGWREKISSVAKDKKG